MAILAVSFSLVLHMLVIDVPELQTAFRIVPRHFPIGWVVGVASTLLIARELTKWFRRLGVHVSDGIADVSPYSELQPRQSKNQMVLF